MATIRLKMRGGKVTQALTVFEALQNANYNIGGPGDGYQFGRSQLNTAVRLLEKGYSLTDEIETLLEQYGNVENVPNR